MEKKQIPGIQNLGPGTWGVPVRRPWTLPRPAPAFCRGFFSPLRGPV